MVAADCRQPMGVAAVQPPPTVAAIGHPHRMAVAILVLPRVAAIHLDPVADKLAGAASIPLAAAAAVVVLVLVEDMSPWETPTAWSVDVPIAPTCA